MSNTESINNHLKHLEYLGRFHALTEMFAESSALVLKEQEAHDGAYGRRADSRSAIAKSNLSMLIEQANVALAEYSEELVVRVE